MLFELRAPTLGKRTPASLATIAALAEDLEQLWERALDLVDANRSAEARPLFERLLERRPDHVVAWLRYADCLEELGACEAALAATDRCRDHAALWWSALGVRARCHLGLDDLEAAAASYEAKLAMKRSVPTLVQLAAVLGELGRIDDAISRLRDAVELEPEYTESRKNLAYYLCSRGDYEESKVQLARVLEIEPGYPEAQAALARTLICEGAQLDTARTLLQHALEASPSMNDAWLLLARAERAQGNESEARAIVEALRRRVREEATHGCLDMSRLYRYVGPAAIAERVRLDPRGFVVRSQADLVAAVSSLTGGARVAQLTVTFVVDAAGELRIADRGSEHVACAAGGPVMAAGELGLVLGGAPRVDQASNQSTGFCPEPSCFPALERALQVADIPHPPEWTASFEFRRCTACDATTLVKDDHFECGECAAALPEQWNFDRTRAYRSVLRRESALWTIDTIEEASASDQDRIGVSAGDDHVLVVLSDGAGGTSGGAQAADRAVAALTNSAPQRADSAVDAIRALDRTLAARAGGEATAVVARIALSGAREVLGASVGDSVGWARAEGSWHELTEAQRRKPLVGSGRAQPEPLAAHHSTDALVVASDGLSSYAKWPEILAAIDAGAAELPWRLVDLARLPSGGLQDDVAVVLVRRSAD